MNTWICIAWEDAVNEDTGKKYPSPVVKEVTVRPELSQPQILAAFKRKFPNLRNHTVHPKGE